MLEKMGSNDGCVPVGEVVGREVVSIKIRCRHYIGLIRQSEDDAVILFCMPDQTEGVAYFVSGSALYCLWWRRLKGKLAQIANKCNAGRTKDKTES